MKLAHPLSREKRKKQFLEKIRPTSQHVGLHQTFARTIRKRLTYPWHLAEVDKGNVQRELWEKHQVRKADETTVRSCSEVTFTINPRSLYIEKKFYDLASKWKEETAGYSTARLITRNKSYKKIIETGKRFLPFIFEDLKKEPDYWFVALEEITRKNPVPNDHYGDFEKMTEDWLNWWQNNKKYYLYY